MLHMGATAAEIAALPAAGAHRGRSLPPRELLARSGSHAVSPGLHPKAEHVLAKIPPEPDPSRHSMRLCREPSQLQLEASLGHGLYSAEQRPAGVGSFWQTGKTRGTFKHQSVIGQYGNEAVAAIPSTKKTYNFIREQGMSYVPHQQHTTLVAKELQRTGQL